MVTFFSENLKFLRKLKKLSQEDFGRVFSKSSSTIGGWENSNAFPDFNTFLEISDYFRVGVGDLVELDLQQILETGELIESDKVDRRLFNSRLEQIMNSLKIEISSLSRITGIPLPYIEHRLRDETKPFKIPMMLIHILSDSLGVNSNWLVNGEGEMFKEGAKINSNNNTISKSKDLKNVNQVQGGQNNGSDLDVSKEIEFLKRENELLHSQLERANKTIDMLLQKK